MIDSILYSHWPHSFTQILNTLETMAQKIPKLTRSQSDSVLSSSQVDDDLSDLVATGAQMTAARTPTIGHHHLSQNPSSPGGSAFPLLLD